MQFLRTHGRVFGHLAIVSVAAAVGLAQLSDKLSPPMDHPAIGYFNYLKHPAQDVVANLENQVEQGTVRLEFDAEKGYLLSVLRALHVPIESQMAVFSKTSLQADRIEPTNPRTIFFNDSVSVAWVHGGFIELAAQDPQQGVIFYTLEQQRVDQPYFTRRDDCLRCHHSELSLDVPGMIVRSFHTLPDGRPKLILGGFSTDHRSPFEERWGGWYVTGRMPFARHMGNALLTDPDHPESMISDQTLHVTSLEGKFDTRHYLAPHSDIVALLVFDHQMYMTNLLTRVGWEVRRAIYEHTPNREFNALLRDGARELVDYLLFIDEAPLPGPVEGSSGFAEKFEAQGPWDSQKRSLRQFDLRKRLLRYPCSYMIYSQAFDGLPDPARDAIYRRMWQVLSGQESASRYARLSGADREAMVEILCDTKKGLPDYFGNARVRAGPGHLARTRASALR
jgi:hypothetical protein